MTQVNDVILDDTVSIIKPLVTVTPLRGVKTKWEFYISSFVRVMLTTAQTLVFALVIAGVIALRRFQHRLVQSIPGPASPSFLYGNCIFRF